MSVELSSELSAIFIYNCENGEHFYNASREALAYLRKAGLIEADTSGSYYVTELGQDWLDKHYAAKESAARKAG